MTTVSKHMRWIVANWQTFNTLIFLQPLECEVRDGAVTNHTTSAEFGAWLYPNLQGHRVTRCQSSHVAQSHGANWTLLPAPFTRGPISRENPWSASRSVSTSTKEAPVWHDVTAKGRTNRKAVRRTGVKTTENADGRSRLDGGRRFWRVRFGSARLNMMSLGGLSVALALVMFPGSGDALREGECEGRMPPAS